MSIKQQKPRALRTRLAARLYHTEASERLRRHNGGGKPAKTELVVDMALEAAPTAPAAVAAVPGRTGAAATSKSRTTSCASASTLATEVDLSAACCSTKGGIPAAQSPIFRCDKKEPCSAARRWRRSAPVNRIRVDCSSSSTASEELFVLSADVTLSRSSPSKAPRATAATRDSRCSSHCPVFPPTIRLVPPPPTVRACRSPANVARAAAGSTSINVAAFSSAAATPSAASIA